MGEKWTPARARAWLEDLEVDEDSYGAVLEDQISLPMATSHELKAAVTIARGTRARDIDIVYALMRKKYPQGNKKA